MYKEQAYKARSILMHPNYGHVYDFPIEQILTYQSAAARNPEKPVSIFPNPSTGEVNLQLPAAWSGHARISIMDVNGNIMKKVDLNNDGTEALIVDVADWTQGLYMLEISNLRGEVYYEKLIVK